MIELNDNNFKQGLEGKKLILVDFYATWCGPCSMQAKVLDGLKTSRSLGFDMAKVDVDQSPKTAMEYGIQSIPTLMVFKDNKLVKTIVGYTEEEEILKIMQDLQD